MQREDGDRREVQDERLSAYLDGELSTEEERQVREAIAASPELARRVERFRQVDDALRGLAGRAAPADLGARLRARIAEESPTALPGPGRQAPPRRRRWLVPALAASVAAALALMLLPRLGLAPEPAQTPLAERGPTEIRTPRPAAPLPGEIGLALSVEGEADLDVIELLDWLEEIGDIEPGGRG